MRQHRQAVRVAILDPSAAIFLFRYDNEEVGVHWAMPGGGIDEGETILQAARRELVEETGWRDIEIGPELWTWQHDFTRSGTPIHQFERILLGQGPRREPQGDLSQAHTEDGILKWQWWSPSQLKSSGEALWPPQLPELLAELSRGGAPAAPIHLE